LQALAREENNLLDNDFKEGGREENGDEGI
jgi:hypothetical protein